MARNYGQRTPSRGRGHSSSHSMGLVVMAFVLGYLTASVFNLEKLSHWVNTQILAGNDSRSVSASAPSSAQTQPPPKPKFEFYTLLENEHGPTTAAAKVQSPSNTAKVQPSRPAVTAEKPNMAPDKPTLAQVSQVAKPVQTASQDRGTYLVQVASFKTRQDAEHMKGLLILKGFNVNVVGISTPQGQWFRVVVGPFADKNQALKAQAILSRAEHLHGMVRKA